MDAWSLQVNWTYNTLLDKLKGILRKYKVYYKAIENPRDNVLHNVTVNATTYSVMLKDLLPFTYYDVYVLAASIYEGLPSNVSRNKTHEHGKYIIYISKNVLVYYCKCCNLIGYATRYLFVNRYRYQ